MLGRRANRKTILWAENKSFHVFLVCFLGLVFLFITTLSSGSGFLG